jgi:heme-degrading monooxygenase HmoA
VAALGWAMVVGVVGALAGGLLLLLAGPTTLGQGTGVILLIVSPILAVSTGIVATMSRRKRVRHGNGGGQRASLVGVAPLPSIGHVRIGYYRFKPGTADGAARRLQGEIGLVYGRESGFIGCQLVRSGSDELLSISQWQTHDQAWRRACWRPRATSARSCSRSGASVLACRRRWRPC